MKDLAARSLIRCLIKPKHEQELIFVAIKALIIKDPQPWYKYLSHFAIFPSEMADTKLLKLDIIELLANTENMNWILPELKVFITQFSFTALVLIYILLWQVLKLGEQLSPRSRQLFSRHSNL